MSSSPYYHHMQNSHFKIDISTSLDKVYLWYHAFHLKSCRIPLTLHRQKKLTWYIFYKYLSIRGYLTLIFDILWKWRGQRNPNAFPRNTETEIFSSMENISEKHERSSQSIFLKYSFFNWKETTMINRSYLKSYASEYCPQTKFCIYEEQPHPIQNADCQILMWTLKWNAIQEMTSWILNPFFYMTDIKCEHQSWNLSRSAFYLQSNV